MTQLEQAFSCLPRPSLASAFTLALALALSLAAPGCASGEEGAKKGDKTADPADGGDKSGEPIAGKPVDGPQKTATKPGEGGGKQFTLQIEPADATAGSESKVSIRVIPEPDWHINLEFNTRISLEAPEGVALAKAKQTKEDAVRLEEQGAEFAVAYTAEEAGQKTFTGELKFAVCQDTACVPKTLPLEFEVAVQ